MWCEMQKIIVHFRLHCIFENTGKSFIYRVVFCLRKWRRNMNNLLWYLKYCLISLQISHNMDIINREEDWEVLRYSDVFWVRYSVFLKIYFRWRIYTATTCLIQCVCVCVCVWYFICGWEMFINVDVRVWSVWCLILCRPLVIREQHDVYTV